MASPFISCIESFWHVGHNYAEVISMKMMYTQFVGGLARAAAERGVDMGWNTISGRGIRWVSIQQLSSFLRLLHFLFWIQVCLVRDVQYSPVEMGELGEIESQCFREFGGSYF